MPNAEKVNSILGKKEEVKKEPVPVEKPMPSAKKSNEEILRMMNENQIIYKGIVK